MSLYDEGHTVAGWTGTAIAAVGSTALGLGVCGWTPGFVLGAVISVAALVVTWVLHLAGWGKPPGPRPRDQWSLRARDRSARGGHVDCLGCRLAGRRRSPAPLPAVPAPATGADTTALTPGAPTPITGTTGTAPAAVPAGEASH
ncbi:HGxxPAAW family protein [Streptomyces sp. FxanaA7]|uniref:HGxxPAAW family protein n=1 Tax=Streptomyces sp. FxanaA7 TaxID=1265492 RepID=UPI0005F026AE|nr:HGxxPAAW family protein [Streptomyces sp. FxanaA7]